METLSVSEPVALAELIDNVPAAIASGLATHARTLDDAELLALEDDLSEELVRVQTLIRAQRDAIRAEIEHRIEANGGTKLAVRGYDVELKDEYSVWSYDMTKLKELAMLVSAEERAKIIKHIPETIIPEHYEPGSAVSMNALERNYGAESQIGIALAAARTRAFLGKKLHIKKTGAQ